MLPSSWRRSGIVKGHLGVVAAPVGVRGHVGQRLIARMRGSCSIDLLGMQATNGHLPPTSAGSKIVMSTAPFVA
jgi:hypothetical protein